ncbi:MAG: hypothetical protein ACK4ND_06365 [Cytophagaceae bacterium]
MGKRLFRIPGSNLIDETDKLINLECDIILSNNVTFHGIITSFAKGKLIFKDMFHKPGKVSISDIEEIIYDKESSW